MSNKVNKHKCKILGSYLNCQSPRENIKENLKGQISNFITQNLILYNDSIFKCQGRATHHELFIIKACGMQMSKYSTA